MAKMPEVGDVLAERYCLEQVLGRGGMGVVYRAADRSLGRAVALKVLLPQVAVREDAWARFRREARVASTLNHPNAVQVYDFGRDGDTLYLAMELIAGQALDTLVVGSRGLRPMARALRIVREVADLLAAAHAKTVIHRDIKPENIMVDGAEPERVMVLDFGMAFLLGGEAGDVGRLTQEGLTGGTPLYMSPEQACGKPVGPASDVYSLGCVLFEALVGSTPFTGDGPGQIMAHHLYTPPPKLRTLDPAISRGAEELVSRMLSKRAVDRPSATVATERLDVLISGHDPEYERARDRSYVSDRHARMIDRQIQSYDDSVPASGQAVLLGVVGSIDEDTFTALAASEIEVLSVSKTAVPTEADLLFTPNATLAEVKAFADAGWAVICDASAADMGRITDLLRAGASEVVVRPHQGDDLTRKVRRALRKHRRSEQ